MGKTIAPLSASKELVDSREVIHRLSLSFAVMALVLFVPDVAHAAPGDDPLSRTLCLIVSWFTGGMGSAIATLGIVVLGIGAMMGKVSWQMALIVAFGLSVMFSGARVVELLTGQNATCPANLSFTSGYLETVLCRVAGWASSSTGAALCTLCVIFLGVGALMGKVSAGLAILLSVGIALTTQADEIGSQVVEAMGGLWMGCSPGII